MHEVFQRPRGIDCQSAQHFAAGHPVHPLRGQAARSAGADRTACLIGAAVPSLSGALQRIGVHMPRNSALK
jgi:hypothetical protein